MEKKSERLEVRLGYEEKQTFTEACETQGDTPSGAVRRFINGYVRRSDSEMMGEANRRLIRRYGRLLGLTVFASLCAGLLLLGSGLFSSGQLLTSEQIFAARDLDNDGVLTPDELELPVKDGGEPHGVMYVLDIDGSGALEIDEFMSEGSLWFDPKTTLPLKKKICPLR